MKKTTRILLASAAATISFGAWAEGGQLLVVANNADGQAVAEAPVTTASKIAFSETGVEVLSGGTLNAVFNFQTLKSLSFRYDGTTGVETISVADGLVLRQNPVAEALEFVSSPAEAASLTITDLKGSVRNKISNWSGEAVDVSTLAPGLYFVTVNNKTIKFIKK